MRNSLLTTLNYRGLGEAYECLLKSLSVGSESGTPVAPQCVLPFEPPRGTCSVRLIEVEWGHGAARSGHGEGALWGVALSAAWAE